MTIHGTPVTPSLFCSVTDMQNLLQATIPAAKLAAAQRAIEEATAAIRNYCGQIITRVTGEAITLDCNGGTRLFLPELPVISVSSVTEDGDALTVTDDYKLGQWGILHRIDDDWATGIQVIEVTYTHGYADVPDDVRAIATRMAARAYQSGLKAEDSGLVPGIASKALGDYSVSFGAEGAEGTLGVSAAPVLLRSEKELLNRYRYRPA